MNNNSQMHTQSPNLLLKTRDRNARHMMTQYRKTGQHQVQNTNVQHHSPQQHPIVCCKW